MASVLVEFIIYDILFEMWQKWKVSKMVDNTVVGAKKGRNEQFMNDKRGLLCNGADTVTGCELYGSKVGTICTDGRKRSRV